MGPGTKVALTAATLALIGAGCTSTDEAADEQRPRENASAADLEREWEVTAYATIPQAWNEHYWLSDYTYSSFDAAGMTFVSTGLKIFDAQTGEKLKLGLGGHNCGVPDVRPGDTLAAVPITKDPPNSFYSKAAHQMGISAPKRACTGLAVFDLTEGEKTWQWDVGSHPPIKRVWTEHGAVVVEFTDGSYECRDPQTGEKRSLAHDSTCVVGNSPRTPLLDEHGAALKRLRGQQELTEFDGVRLVRGRLPDETPVVRAHDAESGRTLWLDEVERDPNGGHPWNREETYAASPDSLLRISYEFAEPDEEANLESGVSPYRDPLYAVISRVDARTGEEIEVIGTVGQGWFQAQVGDMAVFAVDPELNFDAHLAGFRIPPVD